MGRKLESAGFEIKGPVIVKITDGRRKKVIHVNRIQPRIIPSFQQPCLYSLKSQGKIQ